MYLWMFFIYFVFQHMFEYFYICLAHVSMLFAYFSILLAYLSIF